ncbi:MetS family NSS transporter small subunit [Clostridium botulinum]|nr:MetS family NSS transporter small subunit [Clostridium botulinum]MCS4525364.1 MetS family NSS transporter small subunit [Clostridium botulinum]
MTLSATIFFGIGATVLWGGLLTTIIISMKKILIQKIAKYKIKINEFGVLNESIGCFITKT